MLKGMFGYGSPGVQPLWSSRVVEPSRVDE